MHPRVRYPYPPHRPSERLKMTYKEMRALLGEKIEYWRDPDGKVPIYASNEFEEIYQILDAIVRHTRNRQYR